MVAPRGGGLDALLRQRNDLWRGAQPDGSAATGVATGFPALDRALAGAGWPRCALTEILAAHQGRGALQLVMPALQRLSREARWIAWIDPPWVPYALGLAGRGLLLSRMLVVSPQERQMGLWALEQAVRSGACSAVLAWPQRLGMARLRRLQLAAETGDALVFLFRPEQAARDASPAALRLQLRCLSGGMAVKILKRRGGWPGGSLRLDLPTLSCIQRDGPTPADLAADSGEEGPGSRA